MTRSKLTGAFLISTPLVLALAGCTLGTDTDTDNDDDGDARVPVYQLA